MPGFYFYNSTVHLPVQNSTPLELWAAHLYLSHRVAPGVNNLKAFQAWSICQIKVSQPPTFAVDPSLLSDFCD